ncbi:MAG: porin family protein [Chlorobi bacterium]|nr:porin family protein [Chlorobiota bacterium]
MKTFMTSLAACMMLAAVGTFAQNPNGQFGIGLTLGSGAGAQLTYAINSNFHIGARLGFQSTSVSGESQSQLLFGPFFRYLLSTGGVTPYLYGEFEYSSVSSGGASESTTGLLLGGGVAYYWNASFGIRGEIHLLSLGLDPSSTTFAITPARIGVDWFFGR